MEMMQKVMLIHFVTIRSADSMWDHVRKRYYILFIISRLAEEEKEKEKKREKKKKKGDVGWGIQ